MSDPMKAAMCLSEEDRQDFLNWWNNRMMINALNYLLHVKKGDTNAEV